MCGRFLLVSPGRDLAERFGLAEEPDLKPRYNIAPTQLVAVIRAEPDTLVRRLDMLRWGLIPFWAKSASIGSRMINARSETVAEKPAFRSALKRRRCIIPADGFYEWSGKKGKKLPHLITMADRSPFGFAGLWETWKDPDDNRIESCTILTTEANEFLRPLHDRMPVILAPEAYGPWLDPGLEERPTLSSMLRQYQSDAMAFRAVSSKVNKSNYDAPDCMEPDGPYERELAFVTKIEEP